MEKNNGESKDSPLLCYCFEKISYYSKDGQAYTKLFVNLHTEAAS